jgi:hypothetical protein
VRRATPLLAAVIALLLVAGCGRGCGRGRARPQPAGAGSSRQPIPERFVDLPTDGRLAIRNHEGPIRVHGGDVAQIRIGGEIEGRSPYAGEAQTLARARAVRLATDAEGRVLVEARPPRGKAIGATASLDVTVPRGATLVIEALGRGDVEVDGVTGPLSVAAAQGSVTLTGVAGAVKVVTRRGGSVSVTGATGELEIDAAGSARVDTTAPRLTRDGEVLARRGDAVVRVPAGFAAVVELAAPRGAVSDDFSLARGDGGVTAAALGGGGPRLRLTASRGNVELRRR